MARVFMEGCESGAAPSFATTAGGGVSAVQKRTGAYSYLTTNDGNHWAYGALPVGISELYVRIGVFPNADESGVFFGLMNGTSHVLVLRREQAVARLKVYSGTEAGTLMVTSANNTLIPGAWSCIEIYLKIDGVNGICTVKINGTACSTFNGDTLVGALNTVNCLKIGRVNNDVPVIYFDDFAVNDVNGAVNNSWIGQGGIRLGFVDGESASHAVDFTPSAGANWQCVDEIPASDADYVSDATVDAYDLYTLDTSSMPAAGTVSAVRWIARAKVDVDAANITPVIRSGVTTEQQADIPLSTSYVVKSLIMDVDPIDDAAWTVAKVNALEIGVAVG